MGRQLTSNTVTVVILAAGNYSGTWLTNALEFYDEEQSL